MQVADSGAHDAPDLDGFIRDDWLVSHASVACLQRRLSFAPYQLPDDEPAIDHGDDDPSVGRGHVPVDDDDIVVMDARVEHGMSADPEHETGGAIEAQQLDQIDRRFLPILRG